MDQINLDQTLVRLRAQGNDDSHIEVKSAQRSLNKSVWDSISAFANTRGGYLLLGVSESDGFTAVEDFQIDQVRDSLVNGLSNHDGLKVSPLPRFETFRLAVDGAPVLVVKIDELEIQSKPCFVTAKGLENGSFKRVDDKDIKLSTTEIFELKNALIPQGADKLPVPDATVADLDPAKVDRYVDYLVTQNSRAVRSTTDLAQRLGRLSIVSTDGIPTLAALLVFGSYPQQHFPKLIVDVAVHPGIEKSLPNSALRFVDRKICEGTVSEMLDESLQVIQRNLRTYSIVEVTGRQDQLEIPLEVLREGIANAIVHREYATQFLGTPINVEIFSDRVEIHSPGGLWGGKTVENLGDGRSAARNPLLVQMLSSAPTGENLGMTVEGQGSGIPLMKNYMQTLALDEPEFAINADRVRLTLRRHGAEIPAEKQWIQDVADRPLTAHESAALLEARRHGQVTSDGLRRMLAIDTEDAKRLLKTLATQRLLYEVAPGVYELPDGSPLLSGVEKEVYDLLDSQRGIGIREISELSGRSVNTLRPVLRRAITKGWIEALGETTSRHRTYRKLI